MGKDSRIVIIIGIALIVLFFIFTRKYVVKVDDSQNNINTQKNTTNSVLDQPENKEDNKNDIKENDIEENTTQNITEENLTNEQKNTNENLNNIENNTKNAVKGIEEKASAEEEKIKNKKDEALKLVENEWGEDSTVYYTIDYEAGNIYSISVRSKSTTAVLQEYEVDAVKGTVSLK